MQSMGILTLSGADEVNSLWKESVRRGYTQNLMHCHVRKGNLPKKAAKNFPPHTRGWNLIEAWSSKLSANGLEKKPYISGY